MREQVRDDWHMEPEEIAPAVFSVLATHVSAGEIDDITRLLPQELKELWSS